MKAVSSGDCLHLRQEAGMASSAEAAPGRARRPARAAGVKSVLKFMMMRKVESFALRVRSF